MTARNGTTLKVLAGMALAVVGAAVAFGVFQGETKKDVVHLHETVANVKAECDVMAELCGENATHRITAEVDTAYIKRDVEEIKQDVAAIEQEISDYATEQRGVNKEILDKLNER